MIELTGSACRGSFEHQLWITASMIVLATAVAAPLDATASQGDGGIPTVWIEIGGQLERVNSSAALFDAPFLDVRPTPAPFNPVSPLQAQHPPRYSSGEEGRISFVPDGKNWTFNAGVRYGRSNGKKHVHQQTEGPHTIYFSPSSQVLLTKSKAQFADTKAEHRQSHLVIDFQAGRDVGLGLFGNDAKSVFSVGVRFAQFSSRSHVEIYARPKLDVFNALVIPGYPDARYDRANWNSYGLIGDGTRSFRGVGPSLSWEASAQIAGSNDTTRLTADWGINSSLLFGRQKAKIAQHTSAHHYEDSRYYSQRAYTTLYQHGFSDNRSRSVIVPNVGGFAGLSLRFPNAKVAFGYRADFFFGAMDGGVAARQTYDRGFRGPFATVSIGVGG